MQKDSKPIQLQKLKELIHNGIKAIPIDSENKQAVIMIGDTGVGKSTIMSFLNGNKLVVKYDGLKPTLDSQGESKIKIGHQKFSQTSVPTKVVIDKMAFYDCPGFKDNKGQQYEISNSFFVQRLLDIYQKVKLVLVVDQSHISQARADKMPKLIRNLHKAFKSFEDIKQGVLLIINRAGKDNTAQDYQKQIAKMIMLKNQNGHLFLQPQRNFINYMIQNKRILLFKQAQKNQTNKQFSASTQRNILQTIKNCRFVKSKHIQNILSQSAKLSIRDFIDQITIRSNYKIDIICAYLIDTYTQEVQRMGRDINSIIGMKERIIKLAEQIKSTQSEKVIHILQGAIQDKSKIQDFQEDFSSVLFFKEIYNKTDVYFSNLINKIYSQLSYLLTKLDKRITTIQRQDQQQVQKQKQVQQQKIREQKRQQQKKVAMEHCSKMDDLKVIATTLVQSKRNLIQQIKSAMKVLGTVEEQLKVVKKDANNLKIMSKQIDNQFVRIQQTYFIKKNVGRV